MRIKYTYKAISWCVHGPSIKATDFEEEPENQHPNCETLFSRPYLPRQSSSQLIQPVGILLVRLQDLPSRRSEIDQILLCLRICGLSSIMWFDVPVMSEEEVVEEELDGVVYEEEIGDEEGGFGCFLEEVSDGSKVWRNG